MAVLPSQQRPPKLHGKKLPEVFIRSSRLCGKLFVHNGVALMPDARLLRQAGTILDSTDRARRQAPIAVDGEHAGSERLNI